VGNAGSFFKNCIISREHYQRLLSEWPLMPSYNHDKEHVKVPTAWLIEQLGYKGRAVNGIASYHKQPLVLINTGDGNGQDLLTFAQKIREDVKTTFAINLENEVTLIGSNGEVEL
jgi:UDP-N-acetylmuramate dehydrogenase